MGLTNLVVVSIERYTSANFLIIYFLSVILNFHGYLGHFQSISSARFVKMSKSSGFVWVINAVSFKCPWTDILHR